MHCWLECKSVQPLWKTVLRFFKNLRIELGYDLEISLIRTHPKEVESVSQDICSPIFIAKLVTKAKIWKQSKCQWTDNG